MKQATMTETGEIETSNAIIKMFLEKNPQLLPLLMFIKKNEDDVKGLSKQKVVNYMQKEDISSKVTTLTMIDRLLDAEILIDPSTRHYQSTLKINPQFNFYQLLIDAIYYKMKDVANSLKPLEQIKDSEFKVETKKVKDNGKDKLEVILTPKAS
jgi:hypothetical protein